MKINEFIETKTPVQQAIEEHVARGVPFRECIFRPGSTAFREFYRTVRDMHSQGLLELDWEDEELLETDIGELVRLNDEVVPLDVPFVEDINEVEIPGTDYSIPDAAVAVASALANEPPAKAPKPKASTARRAAQRGMSLVSNRPTAATSAPAGNLSSVKTAKPGWGSRALNALGKLASRASLPAMILAPTPAADGTLSPEAELGREAQRRRSNTKEHMDEAEYNGKKVKLNSPKRGGSKKFYVYVKNPKTGRVKKISWGDTTGLSVKAKDPGRVKSFVARHKCKQANDKTTARYWSCRTPRYKSLGVKGGQWW